MKQSLNHVAIIMDGNNRWAKNKGLPSKEGHKEGVKKAKLAVEFALANNINYLTLFAFSTENWLRSEAEITDLVSLFFSALEEQTPDLIKENVKLSFIGDISRFNKKLLKKIEKSTKETSLYIPKLNLIVAASYGGKWDILKAMNQYHKDEKKTKESRHTIHSNWSTLGDVGKLDEDGYLYLTDRKAFMIITGGVNVYPQETENLLITHPKVSDCAVIGVPNEEFGEEVKAVIEPIEWSKRGEDLEEELINFCKENLSSIKCPKSIDFEKELPRHPTGKLYKRLLKDRYWGNKSSKIV